MTSAGWTAEYKRNYNREYHKNRYANDPAFRQKKIENARRRHSAPDFQEKRRARQLTDTHRKKEAERRRRWVTYGPLPVPVTPHSPELEQILLKQGNACKICLTPFSETKPQVDHCHKSGIVRGALCIRCNTALGKFKDDPELLRRAANYIEEIR